MGWLDQSHRFQHQPATTRDRQCGDAFMRNCASAIRIGNAYICGGSTIISGTEVDDNCPSSHINIHKSIRIMNTEPHDNHKNGRFVCVTVARVEIPSWQQYNRSAVSGLEAAMPEHARAHINSNICTLFWAGKRRLLRLRIRLYCGVMCLHNRWGRERRR